MNSSPDNLLVREAASEATCLWLTGNHDACLQTLQHLEQKLTARDHKVSHNLAVVEYYCTGCSEPERLLDQLSITAQECAAKAPEAVASAQAGNRPSITGSSIPSEAQQLNPSDDTAVCSLNKAIVLYQQGKLDSAALLLQPLLQQLEGMWEGAALHTCLLLLDIYLQQRQAGKAAEVMTVLEKACPLILDAYGLMKDTADLHEQQQEGSSHEHEADERSAAAAASSGIDHVANASISKESCKEANGQKPGGGGHAKVFALPSVSKWASSTMEQARALLARDGHPLPAVPNVPLLVKLYRVRLALLLRNGKAAKREVKALLASDPSCAAGILARSQLEMLRGGSRKAAKLLLGLVQEGSVGGPLGGSAASSIRPLVLNNLGVVHHQQGKHQLAALYFTHALSAAEAEPSTSRPQQLPQLQNGSSSTSSSGGEQASPAAEHSMPNARKAIMLYNVGVQHVMLRNFPLALSCFRQCAALGGMHNLQALLLLRTAEAALGLYQQQQQQQRQAATKLVSGICAPQAGPSHQAAPASSEAASSRDDAAQTSSSGVQQGPSTTGTALLDEAAAALQAASGVLDVLQLQLREEQAAAASALTLTLAPGAALGQAQGDEGAAGPGSSNQASPAAPRPSEASLAAAVVNSFSAPAHSGGQDSALLTVVTSGRAARAETDPPLWPLEELAATREAVLCNLSYLGLLRGDYEGALAAATQLLTLPGLSPHCAHLVACYAAEALCRLGRAAEAVEVLTSQLLAAQEQNEAGGKEADLAQGAASRATPVAALSTSAPSTPGVPHSESSESGNGTQETCSLGNAAALARLSGPAALSTLYTNLASVFAREGQLDQAYDLARQARQLDPGCGPATSLLIYLDMRAGRCGSALDMLRQQQQREHVAS
mmetsp:Transcript_30153/g.66863  ORF Transcript_30153/g.66863 Transcript_30153/m.66863 type:complete len:891 (-) Transcript_30153:434-3106(-)|eukprot:CAMPEP_0202899716 /NCGR_PEP_ID=MMETSP1392-20130828/7871_1 /ASSEMBLY_ACC=CAM_ASM_000868 /TAXON_ID=225041 /ORGANISM="Chlamydomonas chlamydogama, Strain SAG 11-48b" /LENGTH=890 /DNA_ID=CAMNT_0049585971 /DNA_START=185 /DNA_END=2857 /DNA_ORIENTATION=+